MEILSEFFELGVSQESLDFVDINIEGDSELFLNPTLLNESRSTLINKVGLEKVSSFFNKIYSLYVNGRREEALSLFRFSEETNANHLGYSNGKPQGKGTSEEALARLFDTILETGVLSKEILTQPITILIFVHDVGHDRMSDLITSILKKELVAYTLEKAVELGIKVENTIYDYGHYWDYDKQSWKKLQNYWIKGSDGKPIILTPKQIVSDKYGFSVDNYIRSSIFIWRKSYHVSNRTSLATPFYNKNGELSYKEPTVKTLYQQEINKPYENETGKYKRYALDMTIKNPELYKQYFEKVSHGKFMIKNRCMSDEELIKIVKKL